jgi:dihydrolipoamide dehydrogenase
MAIELQVRIKDFREIVFPHPTVSEIFKEIAFTF